VRKERPSTSRPLAIILTCTTVCFLAVSPTIAGQAPDPNRDFLRALAQFSLGLDGTYGDEGQGVLSSLETMRRGLESWDAAIQTSERAITGESGRVETAARMHAALGGAYLDRGRIEDALREFTTANQLDPTGADIHTVQGLVYQQFKNAPEAATEAFETAATLDPHNPVRWYVLERHLSKIGKPEEATRARQNFLTSWEQRAVGKGRTAVAPPFIRLTLVEEKSRVEPFFPPALYAEGFALMQSGDYGGALAQFKDAATRDPLSARPFERMEAMEKAAAAFRDGSLATAVEHLKVAVELDPNRSEPHRILAGVYLAGGQMDEALGELETAVRLSPGDERSHLALASALVDAHRYTEAEQALRRALEALPGSGRARYALGRLYQRQGLYEKALHELDVAIAFHPLIGLNGIYQSIGAMNAARQNFDGAVDAYEKRVDVHPNDADAHQDLGDTYARLGRHDEALVEFAMVSTLATGRTDALTAMAQVHLKEGRYTAAVEASRRAVDLDAAYAPARYALATSLMRLGQNDEGQKELEQFQRLQAEAAAVHAREIELGGLRREASESSAGGDHEKAVSLLRKALALEPDQAVSHLNLGLALLYAGKPAEAVERFKSAVALHAPLEVHQHLAQAYAALGNIEESRRELNIYQQMQQENLRRAGGNR
jgi:tetratricopeptide (TPR) repeat protein